MRTEQLNSQSLSAKMESLTNLVSSMLTSSGDFPTLIPNLSLHRRNKQTDPLHCVYSLSLSMVLQGEKQVFMGDDLIECIAGQTMLTTIDLPIVSHVTKASARKPFVAVLLQLDTAMIHQAVVEMDLPAPSKSWKYQAVSNERFDLGLCDAVFRLINLIGEPRLMLQIAPLIQKEIVIRLLNGPHGLNLRHIVAKGSPNEQIAKSVAWLKKHYSESINIEELANRSHMSPSTFRQHFKANTGTSPLQYQKQLRLQEARDLMLSQNFDATQAGSYVGYESASQFSREYSRLFGASPTKDVKRLREAEGFQF